MDPPCPTRVRPDIQAQAGARHAAQPLPGGKLRPIRVLILEDDLDTSEALALVLSINEGFETEVVHDVATCLKRLEESTTRPERDQSHIFDVLLLDMVLDAGHLGTEVLKATGDRPQMDLPPIIVCTALPGNYLATHVPELATNNIRILLKPFDIETLTAELRAAADRNKDD